MSDSTPATAAYQPLLDGLQAAYVDADEDTAQVILDAMQLVRRVHKTLDMHPVDAVFRAAPGSGLVGTEEDDMVGCDWCQWKGPCPTRQALVPLR